MKIKKLLIANRGEIALRIVRAARELGIVSVVPYSNADVGTPAMRLADEKVALGASSAKESYLDIEKLIGAALQTGCDAIHPGYGFLSENPKFAEAAEHEGMIFVGPRSETIRLMGHKDQARKLATKAKVPIVPGTEAVSDLGAVRSFTNSVGYPVLVKAVAGGSGRGMRVVNREEDLESELGAASREALAAFGNETVFVEKYLVRPRHIEIQIFGDGRGEAIHLGERECSLQRRHQKLVEESPAPRYHQKLRQRMCDAAISLAQSVKYRGAGTVEFLVEGGETADSPFYFLEMNTRIQVEHPVTETVTGLDLVQMQLLLASGIFSLPAQEHVLTRGHAIEFRINAENCGAHFSPVTGKIEFVSRIGGPGIREDSWIEGGEQISPYYDSLLGKLIVSGETREKALERARRALWEYVVEGIPTTLDFHRWLIEREEFLSGDVHIAWVEENYSQYAAGDLSAKECAVGPLTISKRKKRA